MKIIVTHNSPDWDAIASIWLIKKFLPGWHEIEIKFVPAGERLNSSKLTEPIEEIGENEVIHVDTGLGALDHHQTEDENMSAASLTLDFILRRSSSGQVMNKEKLEAIERMVKVIVDADHFKEVFWDNPIADYHEFSFLGILEGLKLERPDDDEYYMNFGIECLDAILHNFENRVWAEKEIKENGRKFKTKWGEGIAIETINDSVLKLSQKLGYVVAVRRDPRKGYIRIKARPLYETQNKELRTKNKDVNLTPLFEKLKKMDPNATWYLHVSKKMLLNGTAKNPKMSPTNLSLDDIIRAIEGI